MAGFDWSGWKILRPPLEEKVKSLPNKPGVYVIFVRKGINRFIGKDKEGILDIGQSNKLGDRLLKFLSCADGRRKKGHAAGVRFRKYVLDNYYVLGDLNFRVRTCLGGKTPRDYEKEMLHSYALEHGELPPLNNQS